MDTATLDQHMGLCIDELREWQRKLDAMPETPWRIVASRKVPSGRASRMYDTRGRMIVYANRDNVKAIPKPKPFVPINIHDFGIPVVYE